jgi:peptidoglycan/xylan/chitin deacetylase (PgdA/CDA1 family)
VKKYQTIFHATKEKLVYNSINASHYLDVSRLISFFLVTTLIDFRSADFWSMPILKRNEGYAKMKKSSLYSNTISGANYTRAGLPRATLIVMLSIFLGLLGSATLLAQAFTPHALSETNVSTIAHSLPAATKTVAHTTPSPPSSTPSASSTPTYAPLNSPLFGGNSHLPEIALTFDDGPNPIYTPQILHILQQYDVKATFFEIGYLVQDYPALVQEEYRQGHIIGNHTWSHPQLPHLSASAIYQQLQSTSHIIQASIGVKPLLFRPPYGMFNKQVLAQASSLNLSTIVWDDEARDWSLPGVNIIIQRILHLVHNGSIILLHDGGGNRAQTVAALPTIISILRQRGYTFVTIPQMIQHLHAPGTGSSSKQTGLFSGSIPDLFADLPKASRLKSL